jgi:hypothetical protein
VIVCSFAASQMVEKEVEFTSKDAFVYLTLRAGSSGRFLEKLMGIHIKEGGRDAYQIHAGYPGIQHSGKATSSAPFSAAWAIRDMVLDTEPSRSNHTGSA